MLFRFLNTQQFSFNYGHQLSNRGKLTSFYNEISHQFYHYFYHEQKYDAVVGDTTILANRSLYVDFTLPYTESGVSMMVPIIDNRSKSAWVFLKPFTWDLWVTSACFFVFIGFVIWTLEHRINEDFRGPRSHQVGTIFSFSFSTLVFAQSNFSSASLNLNAQLICSMLSNAN